MSKNNKWNTWVIIRLLPSTKATHWRQNSYNNVKKIRKLDRLKLKFFLIHTNISYEIFECHKIYETDVENVDESITHISNDKHSLLAISFLFSSLHTFWTRSSFQFHWTSSNITIHIFKNVTKMDANVSCLLARKILYP